MSAPGLENGLKILDYISKYKNATFTLLKESLELSPASLTRYLNVLLSMQYIDKDGKSYILGSKIHELSPNDNWNNILYPLLKKISIGTKCSCIWVQYLNGKMICRERATFPNGINMLKPGTIKTNYFVNPSGYILLSHLNENERRFLTNNADYDQFDISKVPSKFKTTEFMHEIKQCGFMDDRGLIFDGIRRAAVPVYSKNGGLTASIVIAAITSSIDDTAFNTIINIVQNEVNSLSLS